MINTKHQIEFDEKNCVGCKLCYKACYVDVIAWDAKAKKPIFKYVEDCEHCNYCEIVCSKKCIKVVPNYASQSLRQSFDLYRPEWEVHRNA